MFVEFLHNTQKTNLKILKNFFDIFFLLYPIFFLKTISKYHAFTFTLCGSVLAISKILLRNGMSKKTLPYLY